MPLPTDTLVDDLVLPLLVKLRSGGTIVYDADSVAHEEAPEHLRSEFERPWQRTSRTPLPGEAVSEAATPRRPARQIADRTIRA